MKAKKADNVNVDKKKGLFTRIGFVISISLIILAFQWTSYVEPPQKPGKNDWEVDLTNLPPIPKVKKEKKEVKISQIKVIEVDPQEPVDSIEFISSEIDPFEGLVIEPIEGDSAEVWHDENSVLIIVEDMPEFPGGLGPMMEYLRDEISYPIPELEQSIQGLVVVSFIVEKDGSLSEINILKGVTPNINEEAKRVVKKMPRWKPGKQRGNPVRVSINLPIRFSIDG